MGLQRMSIEQSGGRESSLAPGSRVLWLDLGKAFAILAVVLTHVCTKLILPLGVDSYGIASTFVIAFQPLRMPVFFLVSGLLASTSIRRPWGNLLRRKTLLYYYLYAVWLTVQTALFLGFPNSFEIPTEVATSPAAFLAQLLHDPSNLWYLWALALFFPVAKVLARFPAQATAASLAISTIAFSGPIASLGNAGTALLNLPWFLVGAYYSSKIIEASKAYSAQRAWIGGALFLCSTIAYVAMRPSLPVVGRGLFYLTVCALAMWCCLQVLPMVAGHAKRMPRLNRLLSHVGANTLRIYVLHIPVIASLALLTSALIGAGSITPSLVPLLALVVSAVVVALTLGLGAVLSGWAPLLFAPPRRLTRTVDGTGQDPSPTVGLI
ncbi:MAG: acyltransferase [Propionicimonas sp.]